MKIFSYELFEKMTYTRKTIKDALRKGFVVFEYIKKDGSHRTAYGTLMDSYIRRYWKPTGKYSPSIDKLKSLGYIQYWDLMRNNFRQFNLEEDGVNIVKTYPTYNQLLTAYPELEKFGKKGKYPIYKKLKLSHSKKKPR